jgi:thiol-disulfide isomerase/thioredoxin
MRALAMGLYLMVACGGGPPAPRLIPVTAAPPLSPIEYPLLEGGTFASAALAGDVVVLDVWASYCQPCKKSFPILGRLAAARPDVHVVGLSIDTEEDPVRRFLAEVPASFAIARDAGETSIGPPLHIRKVPTVFLIDRQGRVRLRLEEPTTADYDALPGLVDALRAEP